jgi:hypothetical protein
MHRQGWRGCTVKGGAFPGLLLLLLLPLLLPKHGLARTTHFSDGDEVPVYANKVGCARVFVYYNTRGVALRGS